MKLAGSGPSGPFGENSGGGLPGDPLGRWRQRHRGHPRGRHAAAGGHRGGARTAAGTAKEGALRGDLLRGNRVVPWRCHFFGPTKLRGLSFLGMWGSDWK